MPTKPTATGPDNGSGSNSPDDQSPAEPAHTNPITRARILTVGYIARHPTVLQVLEWLGWNTPGASMNP
jgi:hypothetical protein